MPETAITPQTLVDLIVGLLYVVVVLLTVSGAGMALLWFMRWAAYCLDELVRSYDRLRLGIWVYLACLERQKVKPLNIGTHALVEPTERMRRACAQLIELARETGHVVTITTEPVWGSPPAMGNYTMEFHVRPARIDGKYGGAT